MTSPLYASQPWWTTGKTNIGPNRHPHSPTESVVPGASPHQAFSPTARSNAGSAYHTTQPYKTADMSPPRTSQYASAGYQQSAVSSVASRTIAGGHIVGERLQEHRIKVPKRIVREDVYEKIVRIPEKRLEEELVEEEQVVLERIVEVAKPIIHERVVEVPQYEYVDKIVEVPEVIVQERVHHVPKVEIVERVKEVPKIIRQEKLVEVPQIEYRDVPIAKRVEVPQIQEEVVIRERPVPQYVDKIIPEVVEREVYQHIPISVPRPMAAEIKYQYEIPQIRENPRKHRFPIYVPKFVERAIPRYCLDDFNADQATRFNNHIALLTQRPTVQLSQLDAVAQEVNRDQVLSKLQRHVEAQGSQNIANNFQRGRLAIEGSAITRPHSSYQHARRVKYQDTRGRNTPSALDCAASWSNSILDRLGLSNRFALAKLSPQHPIHTGRRRRGSQIDHSDEESSYCSSCSACNEAFDYIQGSRRVPKYPIY
eukprot:Blabericola_migrator_1__3390@NODE_1_length_33786_cov_123_788665_g0_i0_p5_GENE_NODE_1_length_33786_cov_123_788665_g0_i0NODE_1_length_33786_cov_123_788665_g0_i0_p5_ORF_typecomplete_len482_score45_51IMCp/PF12314_8/3_2e02IMCp/PF12314_8/5e16IMCp/PF12314_8/1_8e06IMCp/PF12314_8/1_9_NODE_1_length_33786_cov_123_788665_g0_i01948420929